MQRITRYFIEGLLFLSPVVATIYIVYFVFAKIDGMFKFQIPGMGLLVTICLIPVIGFVASNFVTKRLTGYIDHLFVRLPFIKMVYTSIKDLINAFVGDKKGFHQPVEVIIDERSGIGVLGFITGEDLRSFGIEDKVAVYLPQSYNFAGNLITVPKERVKLLNAVSGELMSFIVSGGISKKKDDTENVQQVDKVPAVDS